MPLPITTFLLHDPRVIARPLRRDPVAAAYLLGDLEEPYVRAARWFGAGKHAHEPEAVLLLYRGLSLPVLCTHGPVEGIAAILRAFGPHLPGQCRCMLPEDHVPEMEKIYVPRTMRRMIRMGVDRSSFQPATHHDLEVRPLVAADVEELAGLMKHFPGNAFEPAMFREGFYFGVRVQGALVSAAGIHTFSPIHGAAAVGNIVTHGAWRRRGLASAVTTALVKRLLREVDQVALNVEEGNEAALRCYEKLGFFVHSRYVEGSHRKRSGT